MRDEEIVENEKRIEERLKESIVKLSNELRIGFTMETKEDRDGVIDLSIKFDIRAYEELKLMMERCSMT